MRYSPTIILLLFIADVVLLFVLTIPSYRFFAESLKSLEEKKIELNDFQSNLGYLRDLDKELKSHKGLLEKVDAILPDSAHPNQSLLVYFWEKAAEDNGALITEISFSSARPYRFNKNSALEGTEENNILARGFSVKLISQYSSFINFLKQIERSALFSKIESIEITKSRLENYLTFHIKGKVFLYNK